MRDPPLHVPFHTESSWAISLPSCGRAPGFAPPSFPRKRESTATTKRLLRGGDPPRAVCNDPDLVSHGHEDLALYVQHPAVCSVSGFEFSVGAAFDDPASFEDQDLVHLLHAHEPVGDDERGAVLRGPIDGVEEVALRCGVQVRRWLVEQQ